MKHKSSIRSARPFAIVLLVVLSCFLAFYLVDHVWNGSFVDWFEKNYMITENRFLPEAGQEVIFHEPAWWKLKYLLLWVAVGLSAAGVSLILAVSFFHARIERKKTITAVSKMLQDYMIAEHGGDDIFPREYAEISAQMAEIKASMLQDQQALRDEAARKNDLVAYLAHDLKTPLTSVIGYLSLLDEAPDMPLEQKAKYTHIALDKAYRLENLVNEFFEIARYNLQQISLQKEKIDLYYMLVQMTDEFFPILSAKGNSVTLCANENLTVSGDPVKLARVFNNILKNAAAYSDSDTPITITAGEENGSMVIAVQNQGPTIPPEKLSTIFEKFYRLDEARTTEKGGAGLGLAIAKEIVTLHGGTITAHSADHTTVFRVTLPMD